MKRSRFTWFGIGPPFPWLAVVVAFLAGVVLMPLAAWVTFELIDQTFTP